MSNGNHHSDTNLPAVEVNPTTEAMFGAKARAHYPWKFDGKVIPTSGERVVFHDEAPVGENLEFQHPEETFDRGASPYQGMNSHPETQKLPEIGKKPVVYDDEDIPPRNEPVDPGLVFSSEGMD